jgi:TolB-like protein/Tfp pilus assembly protein PilF
VSTQPSFFAELQRRHVYKVGAMYAVAGWLLVQVITQVFPIYEISAHVQRIFVGAIIAGFPLALILAWLFDLTPTGIVRTESLPASGESVAAVRERRGTDRKLNYVLVALVVIGIGYFIAERTVLKTGQPASEAAGKLDKSIAVLPFENLSDDKSNTYFADGIQDEVLTRLSRIGALKVISRTSTEKYRSAPDNLRQIAAQLGVTNILEGSVQKSGDSVRVNVQLINAATDAHLWADTYDRKLTDVFSVESDIATRIADTLQAQLTGAEQRAVSDRPTADPEAYQLYLKGRFFWNKRTGPDLRRAIGYFDQAIARDAHYAQAYAALAQTWVLLPGYDSCEPNDCFPKAEAATKQALALDDGLADAHAARASLKGFLDYDYPGAVREYERALALDPNNATTHQWLANQVLSALGKHRREIAEMRRALELDPLSLIVNANLGIAFMHAGQYDDAIAQLRKTVELDAGFYYARYNLAEALQLKGATDDAISEYQKTVAITDDPMPLGLLGQLYGKLGRVDEARRILEQLRQRRQRGYVDAYILAIVHLGLGERDEALHWLEQGYAENDGFNIGPIRADPLLASLHGDPRFEALAEKIVPARVFGDAPVTP